jgi:MAF protein
MSMNRDIILASESPRRSHILRLLGISFHTVASGNEVPLAADADPVAAARSSALHKAQTAAERLKGIVIAADTVVAEGRTLLGKPASEADIYGYLRLLKAKEHLVVTGVAVIDGDSQCIVITHCKSRVRMRDYRDEEIAAYIESGSPWDKAGAYGIQDELFNPVETVKGCYLNVVGLPVCSLLHLLAKHRFYPQINPLWGPRGNCRRCYSFLIDSNG